MNKGNFIAKDSFPVSTFTYDFLQKMIHLAGNLTQLGGQNYILSGCLDDGNGNVTEGIVVINGEILPFEAGTRKTKITIQETKETDHYNGIDYPESYIHRIAKFSDTGEYNWSEFIQVLTNQQLEGKINALKEESTGFVKMWSGRVDRIPEGYLLCNGDTVTTAQYPELAYSLGRETEESFTLPDLRKRFVAGYDNSAEGYSAIGVTGGAEKITLTIEQMPNHTHDVEFVDEKWGDNANSRPFPNPAGTSGYTAQTTSAGGGKEHENRPPYYVLAYVIKVK